ncbi:uncharacterized protein [Montipora foliosa]|uniref:uncharacterized protein n=1 Tax=Montipora foliosa TaxID=591990 RepID=UPI0035F11541
MRPGWRLPLLLVILGTLCNRIQSTKKKAKLLKKHSPQVAVLHKASPEKNERGQKKNAVQPSHEQVVAMQNPEGLQASDAEVLNNLQNYNKHYINNEMAAETALLADNGIDDDSALKISNMAALPHGMPKATNAIIKAKISNGAQAPEEFSDDHPKAPNAQAGYDPNAYLYDANSWPEYAIHDSDFNNFHAVEMSNMNGENTDMPPMYNQPQRMGPQNIASEGGMRNPAGQGPSKGNQADSMFNDDEKVATGEALMQKPNEEGNYENSGGGKPNDSTEGNDKSQSPGSAKPAADTPQEVPPKIEQNGPTSSDPASKTQQQPQPSSDNASAGKLEPSVVKEAASLPPKAIATLVKSLVGNRKVAGEAESPGQVQGQVQKNIVETTSQSSILEDLKPAKEFTQSPTLLHKVAKPKKN